MVFYIKDGINTEFVIWIEIYGVMEEDKKSW